MKTIYAFCFYCLFRAVFNSMITDENMFNVSLNIFYWVCYGIFLGWLLLNDIIKERDVYRIIIYCAFIVVILFEISLHLKSVGLTYEEYIEVINSPIQDKLMYGSVALVVILISIKRLWLSSRESPKRSSL